FHLGDLPDEPRYAAANQIIHVVESRFLPKAAYITAAAPGIADAYAERYAVKRPKVVLNVFPLSQAPAVPSPAGAAEPGPSLYWFSQTIGPTRGLECALRAVAAARTRPHFYLRGEPMDGFEAALHALARELGVRERLHILPLEAPDRMEQLAA